MIGIQPSQHQKGLVSSATTFLGRTFFGLVLDVMLNWHISSGRLTWFLYIYIYFFIKTWDWHKVVLLSFLLEGLQPSIYLPYPGVGISFIADTLSDAKLLIYLSFGLAQGLVSDLHLLDSCVKWVIPQYFKQNLNLVTPAVPSDPNLKWGLAISSEFRRRSQSLFSPRQAQNEDWEGNEVLIPAAKAFAYFLWQQIESD